jgi:excisionase family DNA binding protein
MKLTHHRSHLLADTAAQVDDSQIGLHGAGRIALTIPDVLAAVGVGRTKIYDAIKAGDLKSFIVCGRRLVHREDLDAWLRAARDRAAG